MDPLVIKVPAAFPMVTLVGPADSNLRILENRFPQLSVTVRGNEIYVAGEPDQAKQFVNLVEELIAILRGGQNLTADLVRRSIDMIKQDPTEHPAEVLSLNILSNRGKTIRPKTANQKNTWMLLIRIRLLLELDLLDLVKLTWQWQKQFNLCRPNKLIELF